MAVPPWDPWLNGEANMAVNAREIDWIFFDCREAVAPGDLVSAEAGGMPIYQVVSMANGRAWLKDTQDGSDRIGPLDGFHWMAVANPR